MMKYAVVAIAVVITAVVVAATGGTRAANTRVVNTRAANTRAANTRAANTHAKQRQTTIPKRIWSYWSQDDTPDLVRRCVSNWKRTNPDHTVVLVTRATLPRFVDVGVVPSTFDSLTYQQQSDWVRLYLLTRYGGVWMDASTMLTRSLDWLHVRNVSGFGFYLDEFTTDPKFPVLENWFLASSPGDPFFAAWFREFDRVCKKFGTDGDAYNRALRARYGPSVYKRLVQKIEPLGYLTCHVAAQKIARLDGVPMCACDMAESGAYYVLVKADWDDARFARLMTEAWQDSLLPAVVKMREEERNAMIRFVDTHPDRIHPHSLYATFLT